MNIKKIQEIVELMNANGLTEVDIEEEGSKVKLIKRASGPAEQTMVAVPQHQVIPAQPSMPQALEKPREDAKKLVEIKSPMVGTFYRAPAPDAKPYVQVGDIIHKGDVLCIVEAMKLMNEVKSEHDGRIVDIHVENAEPVEFGQTMFLVEPI